MRSKLLFLIVLIAALAALPGTVCANLLQNPSFELGTWVNEDSMPDDWFMWEAIGGAVSWYDDAPGAQHGSKYMGLADGNWPMVYTGEDAFPATPGQTFYGGVYCRGSVGKGCELKFEFNDVVGDDGTDIIVPYTVSSAEWTYIEGSVVAPAGVTMVGLTLVGLGANEVLLDSAYFDTVTNPFASPAGAHSPSPVDGSTIIPPVAFPVCVDLQWTKLKGKQGDDLSCELYWNAGSADMNDVNFEPVTELTPLTEPNLYSCVTVVAEKNYYWRVDCEDPNGGNWGRDTLIGKVWHFTTVNTAPDVDAGLKQAKWQDTVPNPVTFQLAPVVSDDGLPVPPGTLTYSWTATDPCNPGAVVFTPGGATSSDPAPTATMSVVGDYIIDLLVTDGGPTPGSDWVKIRVHANDTTGLEGRYDCEETNSTPGIHDDYSGYDRNPSPPAPAEVNPPTRRGERMDDIDEPGLLGTTMVVDGGHTAQPEQLPSDLIPGGIIVDGVTGHIELLNSHADPNWQPPVWADFQDEVTLATWIKVDNENGGFDNGWEAIIVKGYPGAYRLERNASTDGVQFSVDVDTTDDGIANVSGTYAAWGGMNVNDGEWHHVVGTYDGAHVCIYVDGIEDSCVETEGAQIALNGLPVTFALNTGTDAPQAFGGTMDEMRIHSIGLPYASDKPEAAPLDGNNARSVLSIYRTSDGHPSCVDENGDTYLAGDVNQDCYVDMLDIKQMAQEWLECNDIAEGRCDAYGFVYTP